MAGKTRSTKSRQAQLAKDSQAAQKSTAFSSKEQASQIGNEQSKAAEAQRARNAMEDTTPKEGDMVIIDVLGVPEALRTASVADHMRGLNDAGAHGRAGRVVRVEDTPEQGRFYHINGADFSHRVPAAMVKRADVHARETNPPRKGAARKKGGRKAASARKRASR